MADRPLGEFWNTFEQLLVSGLNEKLIYSLHSVMLNTNAVFTVRQLSYMNLNSMSTLFSELGCLLSHS